MNLKEKMAEAMNNLDYVKSAVERGEKTAEDLQKAVADVKAVDESMKAAEEAEQLKKRLGSAKEEKADREDKPKVYNTLGEHVADALKAAGGFQKGHVKFTAPMFKAAVTMTTPSSIAPAITDVDKRIVEGYRRPLLIADLFSAERITGSALTYFVENPSVEGGAALTTEGYAKPQLSVGEPSKQTIALDKIAAYWKESTELIHDAPFLADAINGRGMYEFELKVENYLVDTLSGTSGIGTASLLTPEGIFKAMMTVQNNSGFAADALVINPTDYQNIRLRKDSNGQYYGGGFFTGQYGNGGIMEQPGIWGLRTVVTPAVSVGTAFVGAFKLGGSVLHNDEGVLVEMSNQNEDDFIKNLVTILIEERLALAVRRPAAFVKISGQSTSTEA